MSSPFRVLSAVAVLLATASATFTSPAQNTAWDVNTEHQISWDTVGLKAPLTMHLAPAGSSDSSSYIATLAPSIPNTGSWTWFPTTSIPQHHKSVTIIIIDSGGHHQMSPPVQLVGWPQLLHTSIAAPVHTTPLYVAPIVHTSVVAPVHTTAAPLVHTPLIVHTSIIAPVHTSVQVIAPIHTVVSAIESAVVLTSLWVAPIVHTSQPAPIIKTVEIAPIVQTQDVAPIVMTQTQAAITKIVTQPALISTEYPAPIVKTILVTETQAPIIHQISQPALTLVETLAPIVLTETQAPIVKTLTQAPSIVTENAAPILVTSSLTQTHLLTSHVIVTPAHTIIVSPQETIAPVGHAPVVVHTPLIVHSAQPIHSTLLIVHTSAGAAYFPNVTTSTAALSTFTTPLALLATDPATVSSGLGSLQPTFVPNAASRGVAAFSGMGLVGCAVAFMMALV